MKDTGLIKILIAEDEDSNYTYLERVLKKGYGLENLIRAKTGREAIEIFSNNNNIKVVLLDIKMPVMSGLDAIIHLKEINNKIPVIAITAYAMTGDKEMVMDAGFDDYLAKPFEPSAVINTIIRNLKKFGLTD